MNSETDGRPLFPFFWIDVGGSSVKGIKPHKQRNISCQNVLVVDAEEGWLAERPSQFIYTTFHR